MIIKKIGLTLNDIKSKDWQRNYLKSLKNSIGEGFGYRDKEITCWNMFHSKMNDDDYEYLTNYGDYHVPVKVRFTSIVKPNIDWLVSKYASNPFNFSIKTVDKKSLESKYSQKIKTYVDSIINGIDEKYLSISAQLEMINNKRQEIEMMIQQEPESEEHAQQLQQIEQQMPLINMKFEQVSKALQRELKHTSKQMDKAGILQNIKPKDIREDFVQKKMVNFYEENYLADVHKDSFTEKCVTGRPYLYVDLIDGKLVYKWIPSYSVFHPKNSSVKNIENGDWTAYEEWLSYDKVMSRYGRKMSSEEVKRIKNYDPNGTRNHHEVYQDTDQGASNYVMGVKPSVSRNNIRVLKVFWQVSVEIAGKRTKAGDVEHFHIAKYDEDRVKKEDSLERRYKTYALEGVIIDGDIIVDTKLRGEQVLKVDNYGWNQLPIIGDGYDDVAKTPYSLIWATRDLQAMHQIIEYQEELLLVISGVKGFLMDKSQMPSGMSDKEWMYYRKLGTIYIETQKKDRRQQANFNQFQTYDDTVPATIQYLGNLKDRISQRVDQITGVNRLARGEMQERDAVGNSKLSIQATNIIADVLFWEHDQIIRRALTRALNLYCKFIGKDGETFSIFDKTVGEHDTIEIPKGLLDGADYDVFVMNNNKDLRDIEQMRQLSEAAYSRGTIGELDMIKMFQATSITEMRLIAEYAVEKAQELRAQEFENEAERERASKELDAQIAERLKRGDHELKNMENQIKQLDLDIKDKKINFDKEISEKKIASDNFLKALEIKTNERLKLQQLDEEKRSNTVDQLLKEAELIAQTMLQSQKNLIDDKKLSTSGKKTNV